MTKPAQAADAPARVDIASDPELIRGTHMIPIASLILVLCLSLLLTRVATVALIHTGMGREAARFQARSAFTGVGFTTSEAESIVGHPLRRRIAMWLMLVGNAGIVTAMATLMVSLFEISDPGRDGGGARWPFEVLFLAGGLLLLWFAAASPWVDRRLSRSISWALRRFTSLDARDYANLLHLRDDHGITELCVQSGDWVAGKTLGEARLANEGVVVLGLECPGGSFIGAPGSATGVRAGDTLILYGRAESVAALDARTAGAAGDRAHADEVVQQREISRDQHQRAGR